MLDAVLCAELLDGPLGELFHVLSEFVDVGARHVVGLAVVPDELHFGEDIFIGHILASLQEGFLDSREVHRTLHDLRVVQQTQL